MNEMQQAWPLNRVGNAGLNANLGLFKTFGIIWESKKLKAEAIPLLLYFILM